MPMTTLVGQIFQIDEVPSGLDPGDPAYDIMALGDNSYHEPAHRSNHSWAFGQPPVLADDPMYDVRAYGCPGGCDSGYSGSFGIEVPVPGCDCYSNDLQKGLCAIGYMPKCSGGVGPVPSGCPSGMVKSADGNCIYPAPTGPNLSSLLIAGALAVGGFFLAKKAHLI